MSDPTPQSSPKLLDRVRHAIRARHYSRRTEVAYVTSIRRYIGFHRKTHPSKLGPPEIAAFLTWLATERHVSASTQNQALAALLFLYQCAQSWRAWGEESGGPARGTAVGALTEVAVPWGVCGGISRLLCVHIANAHGDRRGTCADAAGCQS
jgi:hypothetical protein